MGQSRMWLIGRDIVFVLIFGRTTASQFMEDMERRSNCARSSSETNDGAIQS